MIRSAHSSVAVLVYHSVTARARAAQPFTIERARFEEHLEALRGEPFEVVPFRDVPSALAGGRRVVTITIDDGFSDMGSVAAPALLDRGLPATVFVPSGFVGGTAGWLASTTAKPMLTWSEVAELSRAGFEIGSHGRLHLAADVTAAHVFAADAAASKLELEDRLGHAVKSFAYPYGRWTASARRAVRAAGFAQAASVAYFPAGAKDDRWALPRLDVSGDTTAEQLLAMLDRHPSLVTRGRGYARRQTLLAARRWRTLSGRTNTQLRELAQ